MAHNHIDYQSVSLISAVVCPRCGVYLSSQFSGGHNEFHDQLDEISSSSQPIKKSTPRRSPTKKASSDA